MRMQNLPPSSGDDIGDVEEESDGGGGAVAEHHQPAQRFAVDVGVVRRNVTVRRVGAGQGRRMVRIDKSRG